MKIPEQKVILCGEYGVGKSSLFRRFMSDTFTTSTDRKSTMGLDHFSKVYDVENKELKLQLWDTGGNYFEFVVDKIISVLKIALITFFILRTFLRYGESGQHHIQLLQAF